MKTFVPHQAGGTVHYWAERAIEFAKQEKQAIFFKLNELDITVYPQSYVIDIATIYFLMHEIRYVRKYSASSN